MLLAPGKGKPVRVEFRSVKSWFWRPGVDLALCYVWWMGAGRWCP